MYTLPNWELGPLCVCVYVCIYHRARLGDELSRVRVTKELLFKKQLNAHDIEQRVHPGVRAGGAAPPNPRQLVALALVVDPVGLEDKSRGMKRGHQHAFARADFRVDLQAVGRKGQ